MKKQREFEKYIIPELKKKDRDVVFCVAGKERVGMSAYAIELSKLLKSKINKK